MVKASPPMLLTADEAAKYLRLHVKSVYRLARSRKIPSIKVGGRWRFHREALDFWVREGRLNSNTTGRLNENN
jgi:excisionase family DNA binding protein